MIEYSCYRGLACRTVCHCFYTDTASNLPFRSHTVFSKTDLSDPSFTDFVFRPQQWDSPLR